MLGVEFSTLPGKGCRIWQTASGIKRSVWAKLHKIADVEILLSYVFNYKQFFYFFFKSRVMLRIKTAPKWVELNVTESS